MTAAAFPLGGAVAVVGSRHGSPYPVAQFAAAVVAAGGSVVTGCASGVDHAAAAAAAGAAGVPAVRVLPPQFAALSALPRVLVVRAHARHTQALAQRTRRVIDLAAAVAIFPPIPGAVALGPGSLLALRIAQARRVPVFVAGPCAPAAPGPWSLCRVAGVSGWLWSPPPSNMPALF